MNRNSDENIEQLAREKIGGKSYSTIREELMAAGMAKEEANKLIRKGIAAKALLSR
ncbi:MAG: hypothetical protein P1P86_09125 [Bacteroidales bacterium]|nr:hypothetical protein [Bacteroidales bacterium]